MNHNRSLSALALLALVVIFAGCQQPAQVTGELQGPPPRPAELDRLNSWVGYWTLTFEMAVYTPQGPKTSSHKGTEETAWSADNRYLVTRSDYDMGEAGRMIGVSMMTWDEREKTYRNWWFDNFDEIGEGQTGYCEESKEWRLYTRGHNLATGDHSTGYGTTRMTDDNTMEWTWSEFEKTLIGSQKTMEMKGTSKRGQEIVSRRDDSPNGSGF